MAASDYVPIFFKNRLHLAGRPQMSTHPNSNMTRLLLLTPGSGLVEFRDPSRPRKSRWRRIARAMRSATEN
jgi:hypothetical protein